MLRFILKRIGPSPRLGQEAFNTRNQEKLVGDPVACEPSDKSSGNQLPDELVSESEALAGDIRHQDKLVGERASPVTNRVVINSRTNLSASPRLRQEAINSRMKMSVIQLMLLSNLYQRLHSMANPKDIRLLILNM